MDFFSKKDPVSYIYEFLDLKNKIAICEVCKLLREELADIYKETIKKPKEFTEIFGYTTFTFFSKFSKKTSITQEHLNLSLLDNIPKDYINFLNTAKELNVYFHSSITLHNRQDVIKDPLPWRTRVPSVILMCRYYGMGYNYVLSYINKDGYKDVEKKYFISILGGENGYVSNDNYYKYINRKLSELNLITLEEALKILLEGETYDKTY